MTSPGGAIRQLATVYPHAMRARAWMGAHPRSARAREEYAAAMGALAAARREAAPQIETVRAALGDAAADAIAEVYLNGAAPPVAAGRLGMTTAQVEGHIRAALAFLDGPDGERPRTPAPTKRHDPTPAQTLAALDAERPATLVALALIRRNRERGGIPYTRGRGTPGISPADQVARWRSLADRVRYLTPIVRETCGDVRATLFDGWFVRCWSVSRISRETGANESDIRPLALAAARAALDAAPDPLDGPKPPTMTAELARARTYQDDGSFC